MVSLPQVNEPERTEIGSYFVSNYPPFSVWKPDLISNATEALATPPTEPRQLGLYLHIPFCRKRCKFCYFRVYTDKNSDEIQTYIDALTREVELLSKQPGIQGREFDFVYFGGGTPSYISPAQLHKLVEGIRHHWTWGNAREITFECEPGTLQKHKLEAIRDIGTTRLSLGIEHFDDEILSLNGRAHQTPEIFKAYEWIREVGFEQVNVDLIAGMMGETDAKWQHTVETTLGLQPDSVTIYQMELPHNTVISRETRETGGPSPIADWNTKRRWVREAFERFEAAGYKVSSGYTLIKPSPKGKFVYRDAVWHGADMLGTGVASFSHFGGVHYQNVDTWESYLEKLDAGELPIGRAYPVPQHQRMLREMILQTKLGVLDAGYFRRKYGSEIGREFKPQFDRLVQEELATVSGDRIELKRNGLLRVDEILHRFFEPAYRDIRYT